MSDHGVNQKGASPAQQAMLEAFETVQMQFTHWLTPSFRLWESAPGRWGIEMVFVSRDIAQRATAQNAQQTISRALHRAAQISTALMETPQTFTTITFTSAEDSKD